MVYGLRELKNKSQDNSEWVKNGDFFLLFDAYDALRCATMRYDSASPKTGAWPSLFATQEICLINAVIVIGVENVYKTTVLKTHKFSHSGAKPFLEGKL